MTLVYICASLSHPDFAGPVACVVVTDAHAGLDAKLLGPTAARSGG